MHTRRRGRPGGPAGFRSRQKRGRKETRAWTQLPLGCADQKQINQLEEYPLASLPFVVSNSQRAPKKPCRAATAATPRPEDGLGATIDQDQHYTPGELGKLWHHSPNTIRRVFADEPGVLRIPSPRLLRNPRRRQHVQLRIPARVAQRVHARLSKVA